MTEFLTENTSLPPYMVFPRFLLDMELNETTKLLYMVLLDRARLSLKNEGWTDTSGHVFLYFTIEAMAEVLHKSQMTIKASLAALEKQDLILRKRQGAGHPNRIYVKLPAGAFCQTDRILSLRQTENCPVIRKRDKNDLSKRESQEKRSPYGKFQNVFLSEKELEEVRQSVSDWQEYIERLSGYMASTGKHYQNHAATIINWARQDNPPSRQSIYESEEYETL